MRVMQVTVDEVVDVVAVGDGFVTTFWTVDVVRRVGAALVRGGAVGWVGRAHFEGVLIHMVVVDVMQVAVMEVVDVVVVLDGGVSAFWTVVVVVGFVFLAVDHLSFPLTL